MAVWSHKNGPYTHQAILDNHWGSLNWNKLLRLCKLLLLSTAPSLISCLGKFPLKNLRWSLALSRTQRTFALAMSTKHPADVLQQWANMHNNFDKDPTKPNPYEEPHVHKLVIVFSI